MMAASQNVDLSSGPDADQAEIEKMKKRNV